MSSMNKWMAKYMMISCREAAMLTTKKLDGALSWFGRQKLSMHQSMCAACKRFEEQSERINKEVRGLSADDSLSSVARERIARAMGDFQG